MSGVSSAGEKQPLLRVEDLEVWFDVEGEQAKEWQQIAIRRISSELTFAFTDEGVHVENSPAYHVFVFKVFLGIIEDYPEEMFGDLAEQFDQFSAKALSFITHILRPDGKLPPIGDTEQLPTSDAYKDMFGDRECIATRSRKYGNTAFRGFDHVNVIVSCTVVGDDFQAWCRFETVPVHLTDAHDQGDRINLA